LLKRAYPDLEVRILRVATKGDRDRRTALWNLKDSGFFTSQVEDVLLGGQADFAVHSLKDLPTRQREGLTIAAVCDRQYPEDCLIAAGSVAAIEQLPRSVRIGTSSLRRAAQLRHLRPDVGPIPVRGNILTRIKKLEAGKVDAVVLARAGVERIGLGERISFCFDPRQFVPAPAQGVLAVQARTDDAAARKLLAAIDDDRTRTTTFAERQVLVKMRCGCHAPVGAFAEYRGDCITITAFIANVRGTTMIRRELAGPATQANSLAEQIAAELLDAGGREILQSQNT
jgi:hydroxymethylbilane synthase